MQHSYTCCQSRDSIQQLRIMDGVAILFLMIVSLLLFSLILMRYHSSGHCMFGVATLAGLNSFTLCSPFGPRARTPSAEQRWRFDVEHRLHNRAR